MCALTFKSIWLRSLTPGYCTAALIRGAIFGLILSAALRASAESPSTKLSTLYMSESGGTGFATNSNSTSTQVLSLDVNSGSRIKRAKIRFGLDRTKADYSQYTLIDRDGTTNALSKSFSSPEHLLRAGIDLSISSATLSLDGSKNIDASPFAGDSQAVILRIPFFRFGSRMGVSLSQSQRSSPLSYFVDPDSLQTRKRPSRSLERRAKLSWEQMISEKTKTEISTFGVTRPESRPSHQGAELALAYALKTNQAILAKIGFASENRDQSLHDERGYFNASWGQIEYRLEPIYQWSITGLLGTILETESARGTFREQKVGTDSIGLKILLQRNDFDFGFKSQYSRSNTSYRALQVGGELTWHI